MRIALVNNSFQFGGAETVVRQLHNGIRSHGHHSSLFIAEGRDYPRGQGLIPLYPRFLSRLHQSRLNQQIERLFPRNRWTNNAFRRLAHSSFDLLHIHNFHGIYASIESLAYVAARKPIIWTFHGFWGITGGCYYPRECSRYQISCGECPRLGEWPIGSIDQTAAELKWKLQMLAPLNLDVIAPSDYLAKIVSESQVGRGWKLHRIPNGVDPTRFYPDRKHNSVHRAKFGLDLNPMTVLLAARDFRSPEKGFGLMREALLSNLSEGIQVVLVGESSDWARAQLPRELHSLSIGYVSDREILARWMEVSDVFLFGSTSENFPCIILEAMAAGCCVVATPAGGVIEQIEHNKTGLLVNAFTGDALGTALRAALRNPTHVAKLGAAARQTAATHFSEATMIHRHLNLYDQILSK
jgi:glycosyltransferase involved in cell wall biosynthesis